MLSQKEIEKNRRLLSETDKKMAAAFKVLSDVNRYRIFRILVEQPRVSVSTIARILEISLPLASQHIKVLAHANLLQKEREGKRVYPILQREDPLVKAVIRTIKKVHVS